MSDCPKCGEPLADHERLDRAEFAAVTAAFVERLRHSASVSGCNDVLPDEFPASVVAKFRHGDMALIEAWESYFESAPL